MTVVRFCFASSIYSWIYLINVSRKKNADILPRSNFKIKSNNHGSHFLGSCKALLSIFIIITKSWRFQQIQGLNLCFWVFCRCLLYLCQMTEASILSPKSITEYRITQSEELRIIALPHINKIARKHEITHFHNT